MQEIPYVMRTRWELANAVVSDWSDRVLNSGGGDNKAGDHSGVRDVIASLMMISRDSLVTGDAGGDGAGTMLIRDACMAATLATLVGVQSAHPNRPVSELTNVSTRQPGVLMVCQP